jgi:sugar-specific transcriptional regulator TrmB
MIISLLKRRPCTAEDIHRALGIPVPAVVKIIARLIGAGILEASEHDDRTYYTTHERG